MFLLDSFNIYFFKDNFDIFMGLCLLIDNFDIFFIIVLNYEYVIIG